VKSDGGLQPSCLGYAFVPGSNFRIET
jgi:hypothetical protein